MAHPKMVRHVHEPGHLHELTFSCDRRLPLLTHHEWRERFARSLDEANREARVELVGFVFMPEHVHLLVPLTDPAQTVGRDLARIKQPFSAQIQEILVRHRSALLQRLTVRERPGKHCFRFWQEGSGYDRNLFSPRAIEASLDDRHQHPVSRGLCQDVLEWRWSSQPTSPWVNRRPGNSQVCRFSTAYRGMPSLDVVARTLANPVETKI